MYFFSDKTNMEWLLVCMRNHGETKHFNVIEISGSFSINEVFPVTDLKLTHDVDAGSRAWL